MSTLTRKMDMNDCLQRQPTRLGMRLVTAKTAHPGGERWEQHHVDGEGQQRAVPPRASGHPGTAKNSRSKQHEQKTFRNQENLRRLCAQASADHRRRAIWRHLGASRLSKRDRSLVTVTALIAGGNTEQLPFHLKRAREDGVTEAELIETITHLAFYCGWPKAMSAIAVAKETFKP
jgi:alkylhydroperoxidase/carboxymuconolactone decarboxylase family protein YurZ